MKAVKVEPNKPAVIAEIGNGLSNLQEAVGGNIEVIYPFSDSVGLICNENGKFEGMEYNRALYDEDGTVYDIIAGTFLVVGLGDEDFTDLTDEQAMKYLNLYKGPEAFLGYGNRIIVLRP